MLYWECGRRLNRLNDFYGLLIVYFGKRGHMEGLGLPFETEQSSKARNEINEQMGDIIFSCELIGNRHGLINLLANTFAFGVDFRELMDSLERTIGDYERLQRHLFWQLFNPLYWLNQLLGIPFRILTAVGFEGNRWEQSAIGRFVKLVEGIAAFLVLYDHAALLRVASRVLHALFHR